GPDQWNKGNLVLRKGPRNRALSLCARVLAGEAESNPLSGGLLPWQSDSCGRWGGEREDKRRHQVRPLDVRRMPGTREQMGLGTRHLLPVAGDPLLRIVDLVL